MLCGKCRKEERVPGQRWGRLCRRDYQRALMRHRRALERNDPTDSNTR